MRSTSLVVCIFLARKSRKGAINVLKRCITWYEVHKLQNILSFRRRFAVVIAIHRVWILNVVFRVGRGNKCFTPHLLSLHTRWALQCGFFAFSHVFRWSQTFAFVLLLGSRRSGINSSCYPNSFVCYGALLWSVVHGFTTSLLSLLCYCLKNKE